MLLNLPSAAAAVVKLEGFFNLLLEVQLSEIFLGIPSTSVPLCYILSEIKQLQISCSSPRALGKDKTSQKW